MIGALAGNRAPTAVPNGETRRFPWEDVSMKTNVTRSRQPPWRPAFAGIEPELGEILADPIVRTLMARDGVGIGDIRYLTALIDDRRRRRAAEPPSATAAA